MKYINSDQIILIVDDDHFVRQFLYILLSDLGNVVLAESGEEGLQKAVSVEPDVIILDVEMPGLNGYEVCTSLKSSETTSEIPIIFLTANDSDEDDEMALNCGAADFIRKPISGKILTTRVANVLRVRSAERQLRDSDARYRLIANMQSELVTRFSPDGVFTYANAAYCEFVKKPEHRLIGTSIYADAPKKDRAALKDYLASFSRDQRIQHNENQLVRHDGELRDIEWSNFAQFGDDGQLIEFQSVGRDITERKQIEATLVASEARYAAVVESQSELITRFKPSGEFTFVNEAYCRFVGRSENAVLAGTIFDDVSDDDISWLKYFVSTFSVSNPVKKIENKLRRSDGALRDLEWYDTAHFDERGNLLEIQSVARDITDRNFVQRDLQDSRWQLQDTVNELQEREKQLESTTLELETSESSARGVIEVALDCIIGMDHLGRITEFNPAAVRTFGYQREYAIGRPLCELIIPKKYQDAHRNGLDNFLKTNNGPVIGNRIEIEAVRADGSEFPVELTIAVVNRNDGTPAFISYLRDITEQQAARIELEEQTERAEAASQTKSDFLAMMSHEIRTPLNGVIGILGLLRDTPLQPDQKSLVMTGRRSAGALLHLLNDILDFSKMEAGKLEFDEVNFDIRAVVDEVFDILSPQAVAKGIELTRYIGDDVPLSVRGDPGRLRQVIVNLAGNAVKFTDQGHVSVRVSQLSESDSSHILHVDVVDTGIGIPDHKASNLFEEFTTLAPSHSQSLGGTGLGLAISKTLVGMMNGNIGFSSTPGKGSTFWFDVDLAKTQGVVTAPQAHETSVDEYAHAARDGLRILIVEDNPTNSMISEKILEKAGYEVDTAVNGREAVTAVSSLPYELVLMDIGMPEMDGYEATAVIRALPAPTSHIPIIALTAHVFDSERKKIDDAGFDDYLPKPVNSRKMLAAINRAINAVDASPKLPTDTTPTRDSERPRAPTDSPLVLDTSVLTRLAEDTSPEAVPDLINTFLATTRKRATVIADACATADTDCIRAEVHALASASASFGAMDLSALCRTIESAARNGDSATVLNLASAFDDTCNAALQACTDYLAGGNNA